MCFHFKSNQNGFPNINVSKKIKMPNFNQILLPASSSRKHKHSESLPPLANKGQHLIIQVPAQCIINIGQGIQTQNQEKHFKLLCYRWDSNRDKNYAFTYNKKNAQKWVKCVVLTASHKLWPSETLIMCTAIGQHRTKVPFWVNRFS